MKITRKEKLLLALLLCGCLTTCAQAVTYNFYYDGADKENSGKTLVEVVDPESPGLTLTWDDYWGKISGDSATYTYTDADGTSHTITYKTVDTGSILPGLGKISAIATNLGSGKTKYDKDISITIRDSENVVTFNYYYDGGESESYILNTGEYEKDTVTGTFFGLEETSSGHAGAIYNYGSDAVIGTITAGFINDGDDGETSTGTSNERGGAIYNYNGATINSINGSYFLGDSDYTSGSARGGAICNASNSIIGEITGSYFIGNSANSAGGSEGAYGGAISNITSSEINSITGSYFIGNTAYSEGFEAGGGAIHNSGTIDIISGSYFIGNTTNIGTNATGHPCGGAIANGGTSGDGTIGTVTYDSDGNLVIEGGITDCYFLGNEAQSGGAIFNEGTLAGITGCYFVGNNTVRVNTEGEKIEGSGGAIYNYQSTIWGIGETYFLGNEGTRGGAIFNGTDDATITSIYECYFVENTADLYGGAIYNDKYATIGEIKDCYFLYNESLGGNGGAVENAWGSAAIGNITGCYFVGNKADEREENPELVSFNGGAIYNEGIIGTVDEDGKIVDDGNGISDTVFQENQAVRGGAIYNASGTLNGEATYATITSINECSFVENKSDLYGGAIYNGDGCTIGSITYSYFVENEAQGGNGGAVENGWGTSVIGSIENSYFIGNLAIDNAGDNELDSYNGGAIYNEGIIGTEDSDGNITLGGISGTVFSENQAIRGGAIYNASGTLDGDPTTAIIASIDGCTFVENKSVLYGGAIYNGDGCEILSITNSQFIDNEAQGGNGGAIENAWSGSYIGDMDNNVFVGNISSHNGGAIYNEGLLGVDSENNETGGISNSTFLENEAANGGAIYNSANTELNTTAMISYIKGSYFEGNTASESGGAIYNTEGCEIGTITNTSFINNSAAVSGGAIYSASDLSIAADGGSVVFQGNTASNGSDDNAIYMAEAADGTVSNLSFSLTGGGKIFMYDNIKGEGNYSVDISGEGMENIFYLLNDVNAVSEVSPQSIKPYADTDETATTNNADLSVGGVTLYTTLYTLTDEAHVYKTNSFTLTDDIDMYADVDFANEVMDHFETAGNESSSVENDATLNVAGMNGLTDTEAERLAVYFAEPGLMKNVISSAGTIYAPIFTYKANYVYLDDDDEGKQKIYDANGNEYDVADSELFSSGDYDNAGYFVFDKTGYNPAVMATSIASMGVYNAFGMMFEYNFEHSDYYMKLPEDVRLAMNENAKKAPKENDATRPEYYNQHELTYHGAWSRTFFSNESIDYGGGWGSRDKYYGAMFGFDTDMKFHDNGWANVTTGYVGTMGIRQQFSGGHIKQHGGFVGITESFYKKNFYTAWTIAAGSMKAHEHTMYGHDKDRIDDYGIAARFGWNIDMDYNGKFAILPTFTASYSYVHPEDFVNAAGTNINGSGVRAVQLNPNVKFIWKMNDGWQPYLTLGEIWTVGESSHIRANSTKLPELDLKAYTEYGIGVQKRWANERDAYIQLLGHSDGRDGILLNAGLRWNF